MAALLIRVIPVLGHLNFSLRQYKMTLTAFAEFLQEHAEIRTLTGYAAAFGQFFRENATLEESNPSWMALTNATVQYVPAIPPWKFRGAARQTDALCILRGDVPRRPF